ncbi:hypothetical protein [Actinomadura decatromicini]|uniref:Uncharacterized protein n=1 Tax=Actinomadura decatromicini TaxID=2604572 RepID=A0A5D3F7S9_9ACTN|nr:hypothetical protein [Actinomadura decatromicini]TYK44119.1 hypothetical protein FXF68_36055 [Actinomadura decatromicini]
MSFNGVRPPGGKPFALYAGDAPVRIWVERADGTDFGAQWIMANPVGGECLLEVSRFGKERYLRRGARGYSTRYWVSVAALYDSVIMPAQFDMQGGGNV